MMLVGVLSACGTAPSGEASPKPSSSSAAVPADLLTVLARDGLVVKETSFDEASTDANAALEAFARVYDPKQFPTAPQPFAVEVSKSDESRLPPGTTAWMLHIGDVEQDITGPALPGGERRSEPRIIETDMFTFIDSKTGDHLVTVYIGPEKN
ncbi:MULTISPECIES: hypothetical protein [unclassified Nocardioides]|uniref:hypothetical protein n=1 Tax=unclassified Nocardioides TaxID=2615069 RepID=UPI0011A4C947|nr:MULTISPECIES: hypothetical protein [unclassified Nocardioides]